MGEHHWRILQYVGPTKMAVASGSCHDRNMMLSEMSRYAAQYAEEGSIELQTRTGKNRWKRHIP